MSWRSRSCKWKGLTVYWNLIYEFLQWCFITIAWVKIGVLQTVIFKEIWRKPATNVDFFFSLWQMKYIHNAYSLSKNGIWNGLDLISLKQYIKLNMVLGLKFLRLYIFFLQRWILYIQFRNCTYGIMKGVIWSSKHNAFVKIFDWFFSRELCSLCPSIWELSFFEHYYSGSWHFLHNMADQDVNNYLTTRYFTLILIHLVKIFWKFVF